MATLALKPWGSTVGACYTSNGDYDADARIIEPLIGGKLYSSSSVPPLPVPGLDSTLEKVKKSVLALAKNDEERENVIRDIENFKREGGAALQRRLSKVRNTYLKLKRHRGRRDAPGSQTKWMRDECKKRHSMRKARQ